MNKQEVKKKVLEVLSLYYNDKKDLQLPIPIKAIARSFCNIRLIPFSKHMKNNNITIDEAYIYIGSKDACTDFYASENCYIIYYNDLDPFTVTSYRYRWNIAHELGHIFLGHLNDDRTRISRCGLNDNEYNQLEEEADWFASYILVPYAVLHNYTSYADNIKPDFLKKLCKISSTASKYRLRDYKSWIKHSLSTYDEYDEKILELSSNSEYTFIVGTKKFHYNWCRIVKTMQFKKEMQNRNNIIQLGYEPCKICKS